jgi:restriction endonuclease S subunit
MGIQGLYKERFKAIAHKVFSQGLDPLVPMSPTSVEWINQVPAHWNQKRFKFIGVPRIWKKDGTWKNSRGYTEPVPVDNEKWDILVTKKGFDFKSSYGQENADSLILINLLPSQNTAFWLFYLNSHFAQHWLRREVSMTNSLTVEALKNLPVFEPPIGEQEAIASYLSHFDQQTSKIIGILS